MKKILSLAAAFVMVMAFGITSLAAPSPSVDGMVSSVKKATDKNGKSVAVSLPELSKESEQAKAALTRDRLKAVMGTEYSEKMNVADVVDVETPDGTEYPVTVEFDAAGITSGSKVAVVYYNGSEWIKIPATAGDGTIETTLASDAPVAFIVESADDQSGNNQGSTGNGDNDNNGNNGGAVNDQNNANGGSTSGQGSTTITQTTAGKNSTTAAATTSAAVTNEKVSTASSASDTAKSKKTGESTVPYVLAAVAVVAIGGAVLLLKKKRA